MVLDMQIAQTLQHKNQIMPCAPEVWTEKSNYFVVALLCPHFKPELSCWWIDKQIGCLFSFSATTNWKANVRHANIPLSTIHMPLQRWKATAHSDTDGERRAQRWPNDPAAAHTHLKSNAAQFNLSWLVLYHFGMLICHARNLGREISKCIPMPQSQAQLFPDMLVFFLLSAGRGFSVHKWTIVLSNDIQ